MATYQYVPVGGISIHNDDGSWSHVRPVDPGWQALQDAIDAGTITVAPVAIVQTPPNPDFGTDLPDDFAFQVAGVVTQARAYLALANPTAAQTTAAVKVLVRLSLYLIKRQFP